MKLLYINYCNNPSRELHKCDEKPRARAPVFSLYLRDFMYYMRKYILGAEFMKRARRALHEIRHGVKTVLFE